MPCAPPAVATLNMSPVRPLMTMVVPLRTVIVGELDKSGVACSCTSELTVPGTAAVGSTEAGGAAGTGLGDASVPDAFSASCCFALAKSSAAVL